MNQKLEQPLAPCEPGPSVKSIFYFGLIVLGIFFGIFLTWSLFSPLESAAIAPGQLSVESHHKSIQHLEGGIVNQINIREGSKVNKGDLLIKLDDTQAKTHLELLRNQVNELLASKSRLISERDQLNQIKFVPRLLQQQRDPQVAKLITSQQRIFHARQRTFHGQIKILYQRINQLKKEIESFHAQVTSETTQLNLIKEEITAVEYLEKRKLIEKPRLLALKREAARLRGNRGANLGSIAKTEQRIGETKAQTLTFNDNYQKEILQELRETEKNLADLAEREKAAADILARTSIMAPQSGTVVGLQQHTVGGVIKPGEKVLDIVPSGDKLVVLARVNPLDIDVVHKGLLAKVQLSAFKQRNTPTLEGLVENISADIMSDYQTGQSYYQAKITIPEKQLIRLANLKLHPGMPANVMIIVDRRTPFDYFITPLKESFGKAFREQ